MNVTPEQNERRETLRRDLGFLGVLMREPENLLTSYREYMEAAVILGEIDEGTARYAGDILQNIIRQTTPTTPT